VKPSPTVREGSCWSQERTRCWFRTTPDGRGSTCSSAGRAGTRHHGRPTTPGKAGQATTNPRPHSSMSTSKRPAPAAGKTPANTLPQPPRRSSTPRDPGNGHEMTGSSSTISDVSHMTQIPRRNEMTNCPHQQNRLLERRVRAVAAFAHQPCQIPHAPATSCGRSTG